MSAQMANKCGGGRLHNRARRLATRNKIMESQAAPVCTIIVLGREQAQAPLTLDLIYGLDDEAKKK